MNSLALTGLYRTAPISTKPMFRVWNGSMVVIRLSHFRTGNTCVGTQALILALTLLISWLVEAFLVSKNRSGNT